MVKYKNLNRKTFSLDKEQLEKYLEKLASDQILQNYSSKDTYPIPKVKENFSIIKKVYRLLNEHVKIGIPIHPAGEWLLDNFYIIEETTKTIIRDMPLKKYKKFLGISNGADKGFARIYVLGYEIVNYTDNNIDYKNLNNLLESYQRKKKLTMEEIWNIGIFMQIALIENIKNVCEKIYFSQMQKYRAENIIERLVEKKENLQYKNLSEYKMKVKGYGEMKYPFIEYLSYRLKKQGKKSAPYMLVLEEQVNKMGTTIEDVIKKEHFDIALKKVTIQNCITSMRKILHMDFLSIFENTNKVEEVLKQDPCGIYIRMDYKTKELYRNSIKEISKKTKIAEIYIANKALELASKEYNFANEKSKKSHIGYYLISEGKKDLYNALQIKINKRLSKIVKVRLYIIAIWALSLFIDIIYMINIQMKTSNYLLTIVLGILLLLPIEEIVVHIIQYILSKIVKPKIIPKMDFYDGIDESEATFVVIPTILNSKEKVKELMKKLEIYYLSNKSENIYFALLGDCTSGTNKEEKHDKEVIEEGLKQVEILNKKYIKTDENIKDNKVDNLKKFNFIYRKRYWNSSEECYLGWERKRGLLNQFNNYLLGKIDNPFLVNTIGKECKKIKYVITLDADTELSLNTGLELIGSMAHILNKPVLNEKQDLVIEGHAIIQPRVGITINSSNRNLFTKIFAGQGGIDSYTNAISDVYQDNFDEGIFTGKGIYDLNIFSKILTDEIPENTVLSHDLLEGSYLRCALASDIMLMDGYPSSYLSFKNRLHRWIRGDFQIISWASNKIINNKGKTKKNPLNILSRFKIIDNMTRALVPIFTIISLIFVFILSYILKIKFISEIVLLIFSIFISTILDIINRIIYKKEGQSYFKTFYKRIPSYFINIIRTVLYLMALPDKACYSLDAIIKSIYRLKISKKHLLEWTTSEDAEKQSKTDLLSYYIKMKSNIILGLLTILLSLAIYKINIVLSIFILILSLLWLSAPLVFWYISRNNKEKNVLNDISKEDENYLLDVAKKTWLFFKDALNEENNYLIPDNYQEGRKELFVNRTSSTNIGLSVLSVISSYDLGFETLEDTLILLNKIVGTINSLSKWNGHLYNWYNIKTLEPLLPRYISTVDSGNFVGYMYVLKNFYEEVKNKLLKENIEKNEEKKEELLNLIPNYWTDNLASEIQIINADFSKLYDKEKGILSIGFNVEENKLTDSYYDLLASEARQASFIAISKKDIDVKHWKNLSRTLTQRNKYNGLISWSGTAFEYLMPNVIMLNQQGSLIDESCKFMLMEQRKYAKRLEIPWGFSETAYYLKDLNGNYQYKAIGIPWLGLKRGLEEDVVVAPYASIMALNIIPKEVILNMKRLDNEGMNQKYGFYESIDYTPIRIPKNKTNAIVKTYMAHHQALILVSINNFFNNNILQKRFSDNPEIQANNILLQETIPEKRIITKEEKIKPEKITYKDYENYASRTYTKENIYLPQINVLSNENYTLVTDQKFMGYSKYKKYLINKFRNISEENQGIFFYFKNIKNKRIWSQAAMPYLSKPDKYEVIFTEDSNKVKRLDGSIETEVVSFIDSEDSTEIRNVILKNNGVENEQIEIIATIEPLLATMDEYISHPSFQNLFLSYEYIEKDNIFIVKRKDRNDSLNNIYLAVSFYTEEKTLGDIEYEIDKEKFQGRGNLKLPYMVEHSIPFSKKIQLVIDPILALKNTIELVPNKEAKFSLIISVNENKEVALQNVKKCQNQEKIKKIHDLSIAKSDTEARYLGLDAKQIATYQKLLGYLLYSNPFKEKQLSNIDNTKKLQSELWEYGISGDLPILLVKIKQSNEKEVLEEILKAYEFFKLKNILIDLVILNEEENNYEKYTKETIYNSILNVKLEYFQNTPGGIFVIENEKKDILEFYAKLILDTKNGPLDRQLKDLEEEYLENIKDIGQKTVNIQTLPIEEETSKPIVKEENIDYYNEYGGFINEGKEYQIICNKENRLPTVWSNIMANDKFGTLVTDSMGGFTWSKNSRLNRLSSWNNNQVLDIPSEVFYMQDADTLKTWSLGLNPMPDNKDYVIKYGFGYSIYEHISDNVEQKITTFVPEKASAKISILKLRNLEPKKKKINLYYYIKPVLGENEEKNIERLQLKFQKNTNLLLVKNLIAENFDEIMYVTCSEKIKSYTADKNFFIGNGNLSNPEGIRKVSLDNKDSLGKEAAIVCELNIELESYENKEIIFVLGTERDILECEDKSYQFTNINNATQELENVKRYWDEFLSRVKVKTPVKSFNILMNGWLIYQTIESRINSRSAFYQSGGAYGFRDQLQDTICLKYFDVEFMKKQIIKHSKHQFIEGDVEHWWHEETSRGIRTRFSDDLLWLVYLVEEYINFTGDFKILNLNTEYVLGKQLNENENESYDVHIPTEEKETIFMHCKKAIEKALNFGENGLPKIGSGDWNDGFSNVGIKGKGESVWLGFFLYDVLKKWINICNNYALNNDMENKQILKDIDRYQEIVERLKKSLNTNGWDGRWYKRAFMDNKQELGTIKNEECKIDSIAQSWATISNAGDNDKKYISIESLENHLIDKENGIIKLLDPPFEKGNLEPGYIKAYLPGTRENGGQYTHAAVWAIIAETMLGFGNKAIDLFRMINPIEHSKTKEAANKYKVEPYVIAADIYGQENLAGRGGWTWYTGSSSWMYELGIHYILGLTIENEFLSINPCISNEWGEYEIQYKYKATNYHIKVKNPNSKCNGVETMIFDNKIIDEKKVKLLDDKRLHEIEIIM